MTTNVVRVLTQHNDNSRTGANLQEVRLTTSNVNQTRFGKLFERLVDGYIYAQPLYLSNVSIPNKGIHNVVYVATMHNTVYAFDADSPYTSVPLWSTLLGPSVPLPDSNIGGGSGYQDIAVEIGIVGTPVISLDHNALYVVAQTKTGSWYSHHLHALDLTTGAEKFGGPVVIGGIAAAAGGFYSNLQIQRAALLLANDTVYIAFASYGDAGPYHGWIFAHSASTLASFAFFNTTPNGGRGGIWMAGQGPTSDSNNHIYFSTGNGDFNSDGSKLSDCFVKLNPDLTLADWFSPNDNSTLNFFDWDVGSSGVLLIPGTNLLLGGGKIPKFYLLDTNNMGHFQNWSDSQIVQSFPVNSNLDPNIPPTHHIHGGPVYWRGSNGSWVYVWPENDYLKAFAFDGVLFQTSPVSQCTTTTPDNVAGGSSGMPGGVLSISASGNTSGSGIVWASHPYSQDANHAVVTGILHAYDASDLTRELWNSEQNSARDHTGNFAKFCPPTIANGKVYIATFSFYLAVYGILPSFGPNEDWTHGAYYGSRGTYFADVNGDGRADAIVINGNTVTVRRAFGV